MSWLFSSVTKYWSFNISPSKEYSGLISFRIDWFDPHATQGTLKSLLQQQFESINSLELSFLYGPTLTSMHDYWKNHSFDQTDLCRQSNLSAFHVIYTQLLCVIATEQQNTVPFLKVCGGGKNALSNYYIQPLKQMLLCKKKKRHLSGPITTLPSYS